VRADIYGLGGTLFWCLTGRPPFEPQANFAQELALRQTQPPPSVRTWQPAVPAELDAIVARMMACNPDDRYPTPHAVMSVLIPFLRAESREQILLPGLADGPGPAAPAEGESPPKVHRVLIADDEPSIRNFCRLALQAEGLICEEAADGLQALSVLYAKPYDLALLDWAMPGLPGPELCRRLRENPPRPHLKVILFSGHSHPDELAKTLLAGSDDYLCKPFTVAQLIARVKAALRLKDVQERASQLNHHLLSINHQLEQRLYARDSDLIHARNALVLALAKLVGYRDAETGAHLIRLQRYSRRLAEEAATLPAFAREVDMEFILNLECCTPLHDIGKVGLPDHILLKDGRLDGDERIIMQTHTTIGADMLREVAKQHGSAVAFLEMAVEIARHHHERYDGTGYPDRLAGEAIPLAARIVTIGDVYDALRSRRQWKPALAHAAALQVMFETCTGQFDPQLMEAFQRCAPDFERIFREVPD
jgi:response regulator RpfG family c-di-GMP phosphodiesterase